MSNDHRYTRSCSDSSPDMSSDRHKSSLVYKTSPNLLRQLTTKPTPSIHRSNTQTSRNRIRAKFFSHERRQSFKRSPHPLPIPIQKNIWNARKHIPCKQNGIGAYQISREINVAIRYAPLLRWKAGRESRVAYGISLRGLATFECGVLVNDEIYRRRNDRRPPIYGGVREERRERECWGILIFTSDSNFERCAYWNFEFQLFFAVILLVFVRNVNAQIDKLFQFVGMIDYFIKYL